MIIFVFIIAYYFHYDVTQIILVSDYKFNLPSVLILLAAVRVDFESDKVVNWPDHRFAQIFFVVNYLYLLEGGILKDGKHTSGLPDQLHDGIFEGNVLSPFHALEIIDGNDIGMSDKEGWVVEKHGDDKLDVRLNSREMQHVPLGLAVPTDLLDNVEAKSHRGILLLLNFENLNLSFRILFLKKCGALSHLNIVICL